MINFDTNLSVTLRRLFCSCLHPKIRRENTVSRVSKSYRGRCSENEPLFESQILVTSQAIAISRSVHVKRQQRGMLMKLARVIGDVFIITFVCHAAFSHRSSCLTSAYTVIAEDVRVAERKNPRASSDAVVAPTAEEVGTGHLPRSLGDGGATTRTQVV
jgi:hypothetical protein